MYVSNVFCFTRRLSKKPSGCLNFSGSDASPIDDAELDFDDILGNIDYDSDEPDVLRGAKANSAATEVTATDDPPLLTLVKIMVNQLPMVLLLKLLAGWRALCELSQLMGFIGCGSGCSGSGMDWHVIKIISEAPQTHNLVLTSLCSMRFSF